MLSASGVMFVITCAALPVNSVVLSVAKPSCTVAGTKGRSVKAAFCGVLGCMAMNVRAGEFVFTFLLKSSPLAGSNPGGVTVVDEPEEDDEPDDDCDDDPELDGQKKRDRIRSPVQGAPDVGENEAK